MRPRNAGTRPDPVKVALATVADSRKSGVILVGPVGSGKTVSLHDVVRAVGSSQNLGRRQVLVVSRSPSRRELVDMPPLVREPVTGRARCIVAADDLDTWRPRALRLLADALDRRQVQLVGAVRTEGVQRVMRNLRPSPAPMLLSLEPWTGSELTAHADRVLDAPLDAMSSAALMQFSGGNPLCLVELLDQGHSTSLLRRRYETWAWTGPIDVPPVTFARVWNVLVELPHRVVDLVVLLALVQPLPLDTLLTMFSRGVLEKAASLDLVRLGARGVPTLGLSRPLDGRVALAAASALRQRAVVHQLVAAWEACPDLSEYEAGLARACLAVGIEIPLPLVGPAGRQAVRQHDVELAHGVSTIDPERSRARRLRVAALADELRLAEAAMVLSESSGPDQPHDRALSNALSAMALAAPLLGPPRSATADVYALCADVWNGHRLDHAYDRGRTLLATSLAGDERDWCLVALAAASAQLGRVDEAIEFAREAESARARGDSPALGLAIASVLGLCHLFRGNLREALNVASSLSAVGVDDGWPPAFAVGSLLAGRCALAQARPHLASLRLSESVTALGRLPTGISRRIVLESMSVAYLMSDRPGDADTVQEDAAREPVVGTPRLVVTLGDLTRAEFLMLRGLTSLAGNLAREVIEQEHRAGRRLTELLAAHLLARVQASKEAADAVVSMAETCDFVLARTYAQHASAAAIHDATALEQAAKAYDEHGLTWLAAETAAAALASAENDAPVAGWALQARRLVGQVSDQEPVSVPGWWGSAAERVAPLTAREREIAEAVMRGATSSQVAEQFSLSRRTVENHLQHIFRKLGISRREELAAYLTRMRRR